eukprot:Opistho-2@78640
MATRKQHTLLAIVRATAGGLHLTQPADALTKRAAGQSRFPLDTAKQLLKKGSQEEIHNATRIYTHAHTHAHTLTYTHKHTHARTRTHASIYTHTFRQTHGTYEIGMHSTLQENISMWRTLTYPLLRNDSLPQIIKAKRECHKQSSNRNSAVNKSSVNEERKSAWRRDRITSTNTKHTIRLPAPLIYLTFRLPRRQFRRRCFHSAPLPLPSSSASCVSQCGKSVRMASLVAIFRDVIVRRSDSDSPYPECLNPPPPGRFGRKPEIGPRRYCSSKKGDTNERSPEVGLAYPDTNAADTGTGCITA